MAEARSEAAEEAYTSVERAQKRGLEDDDDNLNCKKKKDERKEAISDFKLVKVLADDARNKTLILHLQGNAWLGCLYMQYVLEKLRKSKLMCTL